MKKRSRLPAPKRKRKKSTGSVGGQPHGAQREKRPGQEKQESGRATPKRGRNEQAALSFAAAVVKKRSRPGAHEACLVGYQ